MREHFVVPSIRSREVERAQRSGVWCCEDALKALDFGDSLLSVHSSQYPTWAWQSSNGSGICMSCLRERSAVQRESAFPRKKHADEKRIRFSTRTHPKIKSLERRGGFMSRLRMLQVWM